jgi:quinohemoprotein ethanol dehydrogenase
MALHQTPKQRLPPTVLSRLRRLVFSMTAGGVLLGSGGASAGSNVSGNWASYGLHSSEDRDSPLTQINDRNVGSLGLEWSLDLPEPSALEATPLEVGGVLYAVGGFGAVYAVDAQRGTLLWSYDPRANEADPRGARRMYGANRGMAYWSGKLYVCTRDGRMIALDAKTGNVVWSTVFLPPGTNSTSTGAPRALDGTIVIGTSGGEFGGRGSVTAVDAETGEIAWRFFTVPGDPSKGFEDEAQAMAAKTWSGEWWKYGGGGNPWNAITYDEQLGQVYIGTGNAAPWLDKVRSHGGQDNLFTSSIVALDARTGKYKWHYQTTPNDVWDFDAVADIVLADLKIEGQQRKVLLQANKNGFFYVVDRVTGKLISAEKYARATWANHIDGKTGRPVETPGSRYTQGRTTIFPGMYGAHDWQAMSYSPRTGLAYIPAIRIGAIYAPSPDAEATLLAYSNHMIFGQGVDSLPVVDEKEGSAKRGSLVAWDPRRQREAWRVDFPAEFNGGTLTTDGNLVFQGLTNGQFNAFTADSGKKLWSFDAKLGVIAPPMTFEVNGKQYVSLLVGYGAGAGETEVVGNMGWKYGLQPRRLLTFALRGSARLPDSAPPQYSIVPLDDPTIVLDADRVRAGSSLYDQVCGGCHGGSVVANGGAPDLRASPIALNRTAFTNVLHKGLLISHGMPQFDDFSDTEVESLYEFIRSRARESLNAGANH